MFDQKEVDLIIERIQKLNSKSVPLWGKMNAGQMMAHCCVTYEFIYTDKHPKPNFFMKFILKSFVKEPVTNNKPYPKNSRTGPVFIIKEDKIFEPEKNRLIDYIQKTQALGEAYFEGKESHSFGKLNATQWNNMFYKHLDHHLSQFGV